MPAARSGRRGKSLQVMPAPRSVSSRLFVSTSLGVLALASLGAIAGFAACVPPGNAVPEDSGAASAHPNASATAPAFTPSVGIMTAPFFDDFERKPGKVDASAPSPAASAKPAAEDAGLLAQLDPSRDAGSDASSGPKFSLNLKGDAGKPDAAPSAATTASASAATTASATAAATATPPDPSGLGPDWTQSKTTAWKVENGWLCGQGARNHGVWLNRVLPVNARIEFDARSESPDGDLKTEVWGDGQSSATTVSYTNATSYLAILGGWKNTIHVLARINEHGADRKELHVDKESDDAIKRPVAPGQIYHFKIERADGKTVRWSVNGAEMHVFADPSPLAGAGHDHFGFNDWDAKVCFDNVRVTPL